jgi:hypothetical protein
MRAKAAAAASLLLAAALLASPAVVALAQDGGGGRPAPPRGFVEIVPTEGRGAVEIAVAQVVRVGRVEGHTVIDTAAWVQQRSVEPVEAVARRLMASGLRLIPLTDLNGARVYLAVDRVVLVRGSEERHAAGARAAVVMVGLRFSTDVAVRETPEEVMAAIRRELSVDTPPPSPNGAGAFEKPAAGTTTATPPR